MSRRVFVVVVLVFGVAPLVSAVVQLLSPIPRADVRLDGEPQSTLPPGDFARLVRAVNNPANSSPVLANAQVVRVIDGDTIEVQLRVPNGRDGAMWAAAETVRLLGVDTPETQKPATPVECYGREATAITEALLPEGEKVRLSRDVEARDRYGRLLAYVERSRDGLLVNVELVRLGAAAPLTIEPNVALADTMTRVGDAARRQGVGLWSLCGGPHAPDARPP